ncbi:MAG: CoA pyrophosphatase [Pseudomonadota bacterium]
MTDGRGDKHRANLGDLDADQFRTRARVHLHTAPVDTVFDAKSGRAWGRSDFDLNPDMVNEIDPDEPVGQAAVLVPIVLGGPALTMLLTQRSEKLKRHGGQIAFPGGRFEDADDGPLATALRETEEEVGITSNFVEPVGFLDSYRTRTGFQITPVVGLVRPGFDLRLDAREVAGAFEVPLAFLMNPDNHRRDSRVWNGRERHFYAMPYGEHYIWGATAGMIKNLYERLVQE